MMLARFHRSLSQVSATLAPQQQQRTSLRFFSTTRFTASKQIDVNGVKYALPLPSSPLVSILIDGGSQEYLAAASAAGRTPFLDALFRRGPGLGQGSPSQGVHALVSGQVPTLTNPNNVAIVCGASAKVTGICGNYFLDETVNPPVERLMNSKEFLRVPTVFEKLQKEAGLEVTILTAKDKLLSLLSSGLNMSSPLTLAFSIEKLGAASKAAAASKGATDPNNPIQRIQQVRQQDLATLTAPFYEYFLSRPEYMKGLSEEQLTCLKNREVPSIYNPHISLYLLELGLQLLTQDLKRDQASPSKTAPPRMYYLSTTDYVQHKYLPNEEEALRFYEYIDSVLARFDKIGAVFGATADHGMNSKVTWDGKPKVVYLSEELSKFDSSSFPEGDVNAARVILPITDPYVKHHSSLGGYATIYFSNKDASFIMRAMKHLRTIPGIYTVLNREEACRAFELPADRVGDIVVLGDASTVLGKTKADHDLSAVPLLRSHGCIDEATVPMFFNRRLQKEYERRLTTGKTRNYHLLDMLINGVIPQESK